MGSQQQFCLRWNNHQSNLLNVFDELLQQETLVDVTLACEGLSMKAHKVVLSACSPYFQHLFADNPCTHPIVILKDVSFTDMRTLVDFMYKGEVNVSHEQLSTLLRVADTLKVKGLAEVTESVTAATAGVTEPEESVPAAPVRTEPAMQYGLSSGGGPVSPPSKRRRRARRLSVGGEDTPDGLGRRSGGPSSRSSTPTELVQHRVFPKTEVIDVSYEDEVMGPERGGGGRASCARMSDGGSNHASAGAGGHPSTSTSSGSGGGGIKRHVGGPSQDDGSLLARISEVPKNFEASSLDADSEMPFTQHLSVVGVESGSPDSGHGLSRLLQQQQQQQRADPGAYYPSTSSLTISEVQGGDGSSMSISDVTGAGPSTAGPSTSRGGGGGSTGGAGGGGVNAQGGQVMAVSLKQQRGLLKLGERLHDDNFRQALDAICTGEMGFCRAAKIYGVNHATLWRYHRIAGFAPKRGAGGGPWPRRSRGRGGGAALGRPTSSSPSAAGQPSFSRTNPPSLP